MLSARRLRPRGRPFGIERPRTIIRSADLFSNRVFANARIGFALANGNNAQYPAVSTDGGRLWKIDGPQVHINAADGAEGVGFVGVTGPRTFFAYGSSAVDVTTDGGRVWWETLLGEQVMAVVPNDFHNELVAYVDQSVSTQHLNPAMTWQYVSRDGRHWRYTTAFAGFSP
jgi:hypothetical protein